jgi:hypothetical protein
MSPFAMMLSELQQLQQSNPTQYQQVTAQISANLQTAAQQATSEGNTTAANQLSQLSTDFSNASTTGQLPNIQDLSQAMSGHHHHGGHHHHSSVNLGSGSSSSSDTSSSSSSTSQSLQQLLGAFQSSSLENDALNPISIITQTLESAGVTLGS